MKLVNSMGFALPKMVQRKNVRQFSSIKTTTITLLEIEFLTVCNVVPCKHLVISAGPWSPRVFDTLFPKSKTRVPVSYLAGHSLLLKNPSYKEEEEDKEVCHAVFATDTLGTYFVVPTKYH